ncbi:MAG: pseudouridine synthase, partial [Clostridia bacterium]|nr:pseudouridine synthase [Clostridia bacterium]
MNIIYEDNHIIVVIKKADQPVMLDSSNDYDLLTEIKDYIKIKYNKPGNVYTGLVHRLDRPVGGVMVFAKTSKAASRLSNSIRNIEFDKKYYAVVKGIINPLEATI